MVDHITKANLNQNWDFRDPMMLKVILKPKNVSVTFKKSGPYCKKYKNKLGLSRAKLSKA